MTLLSALATCKSPHENACSRNCANCAEKRRDEDDDDDDDEKRGSFRRLFFCPSSDCAPPAIAGTQKPQIERGDRVQPVRATVYAVSGFGPIPGVAGHNKKTIFLGATTAQPLRWLGHAAPLVSARLQGLYLSPTNFDVFQ